MRVIINGVNLSVEIKRNETNEDDLKELEFSFVANSETEYHLYKTFIQSDKLAFKVEGEEDEVDYTVKSSSYSLRDEDYNEVPFSLTLVEWTEKNDWSISTGSAAIAVESLLKIEALKDLLIEKEILTKEEIRKKFDVIRENESEEIFNYLATGNREAASTTEGE